MNLQILISLIILSSAAEDTPPMGSLSLSNCDEPFYQGESYNTTKTILSLGKVDLTLLIIWEGQMQLNSPRLYFFDFESRSFSKTSLAPTDRSNSVFGQVFSRGDERIYVPWAEDDLGDLSRIYFEAHLLKYVNSSRFIVLFDPELSDSEMSIDSQLCLTRLFSVLNGTFEVNLVLAEDPMYTTIKFYNFTHHSAYLKEMFDSCAECGEYYIRRWIVRKDQVNKNFPAIRYGEVSLHNVENIFSELDTYAGEEERHELEQTTCLLLRTFADIGWETDDYSQFSYSEWGAARNLTKNVLHPSDNDYLELKKYDRGPLLKSASKKLRTAHKTRYKKVRPKKKKKSPTNQGANVLQDIQDMLENYPNASSDISDILPDENEYYEYKLDGSLQGLFLIDGDKTKKKVLTGVHNMEDLDKEPYVIPDAVITCTGDLMVVTGENVTLNVDTKECPFRMLVVKATDTVELTRSLRMPGKNLFIYSPRVRSVSSHVINLSGEDCSEDGPGGDGGNFTIYMDKFEGNPLKVISNGGKGCSSLTEGVRSDPIEVTDSVLSSNYANDFMKKNINGGNGKKGKITVFSSDLNDNVFAETSDDDGNENEAWKTSEDNDFVANLNDREKIQIFVGHVMNDKSLDGRRTIYQAYILSRYNGGKHEMYDPFGEPIPGNTSSSLMCVAMQTEDSTSGQGHRSKRSSVAKQCYPLTISGYEMECAIDLTKGNVSNLSHEVAMSLNDFSVEVTDCLQIDLQFVSEFDLILCKLSGNGIPGNMSHLSINDELTCYRALDETVACHRKRPNCDVDGITNLAVDFALAISTVRHIKANPLRMIRAPLTELVLESNNLYALSKIYRETYLSLVRDLYLFYEKILKPKAEAAVSKMTRNLFDRRKKSFAHPRTLDGLRWSAFLKTGVLGFDTGRYVFPRILEELVLPGKLSLPLLANLEKDILSRRISAFDLYLKILHSELESAELPEQLKQGVFAHLEKVSRSVSGLIGDEARNGATCGINLTLLSKISIDFKKNFNTFEARLPKKLLTHFRRRIRKYVSKHDEVLDVIQSIVALAKDKEEMETALPHALELAERTNASFMSFDIYFELIRAFENAVSEPNPYLNELYVKLLQNLNSERDKLMRQSNSEIADLRSELETAFDLELEAYRALQTFRRVEDVRIAYEKVSNRSGGFGSNAEAIERMYDVLEDGTASLVFATARNEFEYRIFPFSEDVTPVFDSGNLEASIKELKKREKKYRRFFEYVPFDPGNCNSSCQPFYFWSVRDIRRQGQNIKQLFEGEPLFLFADSKNVSPRAIKSRDFRIRFASNFRDLEERAKGTGVLLQPATFSYLTFRNEVYLTTSKDIIFEHVLGETPVPTKDRSPSVSPYTMWRIQLLNISRDLESAEDLVGGIELVGEGEIVADRPELAQSSKPEEWEYEDIYLTLL